MFTVTLIGLAALPQGEYTGEVGYEGSYGAVSKSITVNKIGITPRAGPDDMTLAGFLQDIRPTLSAEDLHGEFRCPIDVSFLQNHWP